MPGAEQHFILEKSKDDAAKRRRTRSKSEVAENLKSLSDQISSEAKRRGLTPQKLREIMSVDEEELQNTIGY